MSIKLFRARTNPKRKNAAAKAAFSPHPPKVAGGQRVAYGLDKAAADQVSPGLAERAAARANRAAMVFCLAGGDRSWLGCSRGPGAGCVE